MAAAKKKKGIVVLTRILRARVPSCAAKPSPRLGQQMMYHGPSGINMAEFCKKFNAQCEVEGWKKDLETQAVIRLFSDRTWTIEIRYPTAKSLMFKAANIEKGPAFPGHESHFWSWIDIRQIYELSKIKMEEPHHALKSHSALAKLMAYHAQRNLNVKVVQLGGPPRKKKFERVFKPPYDIWKLFDDSSFDHALDQRKKTPYHHGDLKNMFGHTQNFFGQQAVSTA